MRRAAALTATVLLLIAGAHADDDPRRIGTMLSGTLEGYIRPGYSRFAEAASDLAETTAILCEQPSPANLAKARAGLRETTLAWAGIEWFRIGPVMVENRVERILFYPDRKGTGLKQVERAIAGADRTTTEQDSLAGKSVAMQGLGALEFLLFGTGNRTLETGDPYRCAYVHAIAENLSTIASVVSERWSEETSISRQWLAPANDNPWFTTEPDIVAKITGEIIRGLEVVKDTRIGAFLRDPPKGDRPKSAVLWRSASTMPVIAADLKGLRALFVESRIETVLPDGYSALTERIRSDFDHAVSIAESFDQPVAEIVETPQLRARLVDLRLVIGSLIRELDEEFLKATGLSIGFSFYDGD